jgi:hypothetical protein
MADQGGGVPKGILYLYREPDRPGRRSNLFSFVRNPLDASNELKGVMARTYAGFYAYCPESAQWTVISTERDRLVLPDAIEPGPIYVHFVSAKKEIIKSSVYRITRQQLENLAASVMLTHGKSRN